MTYEPGTVAVATVRGVPNVRVFRFRDVYGRPRWDAVEAIDQLVTWPDEQVTDVRPLVVLDTSHIGDALTGLERVLISELPMLVDEVHALHELAKSIEAQTKPPRIPEPGPWGVVEAATNDEPSKRKAFVRYPHEGWCADAVSAYEWRLLVDPVLIRDGIEDES